MSIFPHVPKRHLLKGGFLMTSVVGANFLNFLFNALLGRELGYADFGLVTLVATLYSISALFTNALASTINFTISKMSREPKIGNPYRFLTGTLQKSLGAVLIFSVIWCAFIPTLMNFFHVQNFWPFLFFVPLLIFSVQTYAVIGFLQGRLEFFLAGLVIMAEPVFKLVTGMTFLAAGLDKLAYIAIPVSLVMAAAAGMLVLRVKKLQEPVLDGITVKPEFPKKFFSTVIALGIGSTLFFSVDLLLVKHLFEPGISDQYALVSLVGKMTYFFSVLLNMFTLPIVARSKFFNNKLFLGLVFGTAGLALTAWLVLGVFSPTVIPLLFGEKTASILYLLPGYTLGVALYAVASVIVSFHTAHQEYLFSYPLIAAGIMAGIMILARHSNLQEVTENITFSSGTLLLTLTAMHLFFRRRTALNGS